MIKSLKYWITVAVLGCMVYAPALAQDRKMYTWTDENGTVHFSEVAPQGQDVTEHAIPQEAAPQGDNPYAAPDTGPSYAEERRAEIARNNELQQAEKSMMNARCAAWQAEVERLEPNRRVYFTNEQGETERMDDVERADRVAQLKSQISQNCKS